MPNICAAIVRRTHARLDVSERSAIGTIALRAARLQRLLQRAQRPWTRYVERRALERYSALAGRLFAQLDRTGQGGLARATPQITAALITRSDVAVLLVNDLAAGPANQVLKLPLTAAACHSTTLHRQVLAELHAQPALRDFCTLVPQPLAWGVFEDQEYYLETALDGLAASDLVRQDRTPAALKREAVWAIRKLHLSTAQRRSVDALAFAKLAGDDLALLYRLGQHWPEPALLRDKLQSVEALLRRRLIGSELPFGWVHGDFWPGNLLVRPAGELSGIIDWDRALPGQLPLLDILHLFAYMRKMHRHIELGEAIVEYLLPAAFDAEERALMAESLAVYGLPADPEFLQAATWLYWLRFASANLVRYPKFQNDTFWLSRNVYTVLKRG
jgi:aminoglycoside phosphotransferase